MQNTPPNAKRPPHLPIVQINDERVTARPGETVLAAALRAGIEMPYGCGVGGCGSCKCRLAEGTVRELTETAYLLSADEIEEGYVLACQSIPTRDVRVEVDVTRAPQRPRGIAGRVVSCQALTHDIVRLVLRLDTQLEYRAGQFARLTIQGLEGVSRSYSFAAAPQGEAARAGFVEFFVRRVPGGRFSTFVHDEAIVGREVHVEGPFGDFWLRSSDKPLLCVAGGSGLAPLLALLEQAAAEGVRRPVTLLFGARAERDLYAQERIAALAERWSSTFVYLPVLSEEPEDATWSGARGLVTDHLVEAIAGAGGGRPQAYLCGPPGLIDAAVERLIAAGVEREEVRFDKFEAGPSAAATPRETTPPVDGSALVNLLHYVKFFSFHLVGLGAAASLLAGGPFATVGLGLVLAFYVLGDAVLGDDVSTPTYRRPWVLTAQLWLALPLLASIVGAGAWSVSAGDPLGLGAALGSVLHHDLVAAKAADSPLHWASAIALTGLMIGMVGIIPAHELTHRTWDPISMLVGRWLLAFSFDTGFSIEHVYGHHRYVSTVEDPATAPRGRSVYAHIVLSTIAGNRSAFRIEAARLEKRRLAVWGPHNAYLRGHLMSGLLLVGAAVFAGWRGAVFLLASAAVGKALLEIVNYMEHYGLVREPTTPVAPRHSWNTNRLLSSWALFNITRHSHHHAAGEVPYQDLKPYPRAPMMINGYLTTLLIALIPPLWHALMTPRVLAWDRDFATEEERALVRRANRSSGLAAFRRALDTTTTTTMTEEPGATGAPVPSP